MDGTVLKRQSGKRPKKKKFRGNQHAKFRDENLPDTSGRVSSSARKLAGADKSVPATSSVQYRLIDISLLFSNIQNTLLCRICHGEVSFKEKSLSGLSSTISITCENCDEINQFRSDRLIGKNNNIPEINRRSIFAMRCVGKGLSALETFCSVMCLPPPVSQKAYDEINRKISIASSAVAEASMKMASIQEVEANDDNTDITVSGDGTWKTRGHSSLVGACSVIGANTGKVIDINVRSSYCKGCEYYKGPKRGPRFQKWQKNHAKVCRKNHYGSAAKMEVDGMLDIFSRSITKRGVRYNNYIGDGDTKTYLSVKNADPYKGLHIEKLECVTHVQKRMGSRLRKLKSLMQNSKLSDGKTIGGKGRLTESLMLKLTSLYGNAIRTHKGNLKNMREAIWAVWAHTASTDTEPMHYFCPKGKDTWCSYNRAVIEKKNFKHLATVPKPVMLAIKPIFKDLSEPSLIKRCLGGKTQNPNESFNATVWKYCPKTIGCGKLVADIAAYIATVLFNDGNKGVIDIMEKLDLSVSEVTIENLRQKDQRRIQTAEIRAMSATHEARKSRKRKKMMHEESQKKSEGEIYAAGSF